MNGDSRKRDRRDLRSFKRQKKLLRSAEEELESKLGFDLFSEGEKKLGWLLTFAPSSWEDPETSKVYSCIDLYFVTQDGTSFKSKYKFRPYFYAATKDKMEMDVEAYLRRKYESQVADIEIMEKEDLNLKNHLSGLQKSYLKISFDSVQQLMNVKNDLLHVVERNRAKMDAAEAYESILMVKRDQKPQDFLDYIVDLREFDVPYHVRFAIDNDVRCGQWYDVSVSSTGVMLEKRIDLLQRAEVRVCAFDIETTKLPLKFPDAEYDLIMMISYMIDGKGYLIINRECVGEDIENLEYTPKPEFEGHFEVMNLKNELELLKRWFGHMQELKPGIYVTYNGDFFDWPFLERRAAYHGLKMSDAVTKAKLGYDPLEVNPEDMVRFAKEKPQMMASYSVSDAVATYYLYMTYVHPFIFSLATIIPMSPDEVLRKGSGTLCEMLLMVQAYKANVICPNKHQSDSEKFYNNHLLESETYIGGHVECLESGVFRSDLPTQFKLDPSAYQQLIDNLDRDLQYAIRVEGKMDLETVSNYDEVKNTIREKLASLRDDPIREECPLIYHLDVAAMYPNIILTNRLQPPSIVTDEVCTACDFNRPGKTCLRKLEWVWRGEIFMAKRSDYYHLKKQIESEFVDTGDGQLSKSFLDLPKKEQQSKLKERLKKYCQKAYKRVLDKPVTELREAGICMRENPFYVDTVRSFRDRRYEYKGLNKVWKGKQSEAKASGNSIKIQEAQDMVVLYDSLQLAHKCILNSFYGYVMRKGARWYSMEMAGVVTYTGAKIIQNARLLVDKIGKPLELDTDGFSSRSDSQLVVGFQGVLRGVWQFSRDSKKKLMISYPCVMLNADVARNNTNDQYQTLIDPINKTYATHSECSIEFEVDGPYKAMILPASKEEGILIKKRYAVFNDDGTLAELKGFEIKRRGELKLIKVFQAELFDKFLHGTTLEECYSSVAAVADRWLDLLDNQGEDIADSELLDYISESSTMSKSLVDYGEQKSCAVTTARRLADFLGEAMVKDKGLRCQYIVACEPRGTPVSERAVPVAIFETDENIMKYYIKKWCKTSSAADIRSIIDWSYYKQRLSSAIQKIVTIPAAMQKVANPVPRVVHPDWLHKKVREKEDKFQQRKLSDIFKTLNKDGILKTNDGTVASTCLNEKSVQDIEDFHNRKGSSTDRPRPIVRHYEGNTERHSDNGIHQINGHQKEISKESEHQDPSSMQQQAMPVQDIDRNLDYQGWLELKKRKWKETLERKKRQRLGNSKNSHLTNGPFKLVDDGMGNKAKGKSGVTSYFKRRDVALTRSYWQILQLINSKNGQFLAWVVVDGIMLKIPIHVPRVFYLNSKGSITEEFPGRRVNKTLPHGRQNHNLIEVIIDEVQFIAESKKLAALLADPEIEGLYETKVPLGFSTILQIGCVKFTSISWTHDNKGFFYCRYPTPNMCEGRAIYAGYFPALRTIHVVVVNPFQNRDLTASFLDKQFRDACQALDIESPLLQNGATFKVDYVGHVKDAEKILLRSINEHRHDDHGPTIAVTESPEMHLLRSSIQALDDFPCVSIPSNARDSQYPAVGWQQVAARIGMQRCAASSRWLNERISLARYAHVPVGNFELDWLMFTADIFFSRALRDQQQVLWISENGVPDLGGTNDEDTCFADEVHQPVLIYPGAYRKVSVELKIHHLAVNALLKSNQVNEIEGGALLSFDEDAGSGLNASDKKYAYDDTTSCASAFRVLKQLIQRCLADAVTSGNIYADALLQHLYRWLCSPKSKLHDPALHRMLHKVMQKVFALLLAELRKLGASIIFANFSKVIIDTGKYDISAARAYSDSLVKTLQNRDLFEWIELEPVQFWHSLLYMDQYNYGGIPVEADEIISSWSIAEHLPHAIQNHFITIVSEFIQIPWAYVQKEAANRSSSTDGDFCTPSITISAAEMFESCVVAYLREKIGSHFSDKLLKVIRDMVIHMKGINRSEDNDHRSPESSQPLSGAEGDFTLEFIKHVCAVLALDQTVQHDVLVMRKNLLRYVRVKEFAPEAEFRGACQSFTLPNVICSYCNDCRDLDLSRDSSLLVPNQEWHCRIPRCGQPYDRQVMENALLQIVRQRERLYHMQDLICLRCNQVKAAHLSEQCNCAGSYRCREDESEFRSKMQIFLKVADNQKFQLLKECTSWILQVR
ncbi:hypothetical protein CDL15_Pgr026779 [Punica granatum]|uniref:DNA polymerase epsilon catalytic subunit n=1 Tax=Punica granatum TaxID=22663 RepID=A0A218WMH4_PUNGR|nr:hypothetical protein CDL15_Pgr026779 [Punica granatum]